MAKKAGNKRFPVVLCVLAVLCLALAIGANIAANMFSSLLDHYVGARPTEVVKAAGSEDWDAEYYDGQCRGRNQATKAATEVVTQIEAEGIVLLKNDNAALPLASGTNVSLLGRYAADPVYGGAGSGTVDPNDCIDLYQGISEAGLAINDTAYNWIKENYANYAKAAITMDDPTTASYYIGEIPWADYSSEAQASIAGTTGLVVIGRGGGEGGDLSTNLKADLESGVSSNFTANAETANYEDGQHELQLTKEEKDLIAAAKASCDKVIVIINASTTLQIPELVEEGGAYEADAIIEIGSPGAAGSRAVGQVLTDFNLYSYMHKQQALYGGTDAQLTYSAMTGKFQDTKSAAAVTALREANHRLLFAVANSNAMQDMVPGSTIKYGIANWQYMIWGGSAVLVALAAPSGGLVARFVSP